MTTVNYLPFIRREKLVLPPGDVAGGNRVLATSTISGLSSGSGARAFLTDAYVYPDIPDLNPVTNVNDFQNIEMRYGVYGRSFLTAKPYPIRFSHDGPVQETGCWRLAKPYRVFPGEKLTARLDYNDPGGAFNPDRPILANAYETFPAIIFHGVKVTTNQPFLLYDRHDELPNLRDSILLNKDTLRCPDDSPVDILAVTTNIPYFLLSYLNEPDTAGAIYSYYPSAMIWGPDGRQWWDDPSWASLFCLRGTVIDLNKPEWVLEPEETLVFEFTDIRTNQDSEFGLWVTVRGSYEVSL